jgi:hypothetical protein
MVRAVVINGADMVPVMGHGIPHHGELAVGYPRVTIMKLDIIDIMMSDPAVTQVVLDWLHECSSKVVVRSTPLKGDNLLGVIPLECFAARTPLTAESRERSAAAADYRPLRENDR